MGDRFLLHPVRELSPELALTELQTYRPLRFGPTGSATDGANDSSGRLVPILTLTRNPPPSCTAYTCSILLCMSSRHTATEARSLCELMRTFKNLLVLFLIIRPKFPTPDEE